MASKNWYYSYVCVAFVFWKKANVMLVCVCDLQKLKILVRVDFHFPRHHKKIALAIGQIGKFCKG